MEDPTEQINIGVFDGLFGQEIVFHEFNTVLQIEIEERNIGICDDFFQILYYEVDLRKRRGESTTHKPIRSTDLDS